MNQTTEDRKKELFDRISTLYDKRDHFDIDSDEYRDCTWDIEFLQDDLDALNRVDCVASGEHMRMITPSGGYDVCFNCGSKS